MLAGTQAACGLAAALCLGGCAGAEALRVVTVPVADVRAAAGTRAQPAAHDPGEETQVVYGERVRVVRTQDEWAYVEAIEQPEFTHAQRWQGYPGWVPRQALSPIDPLRLGPNIVVTEPWAAAFDDAHLLRASRWRFPMGTHLRATELGRHVWQVELFDGTIVWLPYRAARLLEEAWALPPAERRRLIVAHAQRFLGSAYYWGGRTPATDALPGQVTGVDCSGLVNLAYRAVGVDVPRDAHEQFLRARRVDRPGPADLVFLSERGNPARIVHVMLDAGDGRLIEGPGTGQAVRRISWTERLGASPETVPNGHVVNEQTVYYGAFLP